MAFAHERLSYRRHDAHPSTGSGASFVKEPVLTRSVPKDDQRLLSNSASYRSVRVNAPAPSCFAAGGGLISRIALILPVFFTTSNPRRAQSLCIYLRCAQRQFKLSHNGSFWLKSILTANPHLRGILYDQENVVKDHVLADLAGRVEIQAGNFFERVPAADVLLMKNVLHDWSDEKCRVILSQCR